MRTRLRRCLLMADVVDRQLEATLQVNAVPLSWGTKTVWCA